MLRPACDSLLVHDNSGYFNDATNSRVQLMPSFCSCLLFRPVGSLFPFRLNLITNFTGANSITNPNGIRCDLSNQSRKHSVFSMRVFHNVTKFNLRRLETPSRNNANRKRAIRLVASLFPCEVTQATAVCAECFMRRANHVSHWVTVTWNLKDLVSRSISDREGYIRLFLLFYFIITITFFHKFCHFVFQNINMEFFLIFYHPFVYRNWLS